MAKTNFENLEVYKLSEGLADEIWKIMLSWNSFSQDTIGKQIVKAADSVEANIAEGTERGSFEDNKRFVKIARGSLFETRHWLRRANKRKLLTSEQIESLKKIIDELSPRLNAYLKSIGPVVSPGNGQLTNNN